MIVSRRTLSRRTVKWIDEDGDIDEAHRYVYDGNDLYLQFDSGGTLTHLYLHGPGVDEVLADQDFTGAAPV